MAWLAKASLAGEVSTFDCELAASGDFQGGIPGDLDCEDIGEEVWVGNYDPHGLDGDGDGWGCEGW